MSKKRKRGISMAERLQATHGQSQSLPAIAHPAPVPSGRLRGATIQPHVHPTHDQLQPLPEVVRPSLIPSGHLRGATIQPRAQHIRHTMTDGQLPSVPEVVPSTPVPLGHSRGATTQPRAQHIRHTMTDGQLPSVPEVEPSTLVPSDHSRVATIHPRSQPMRHTTSDDHSQPIEELVRLTQTSSSHSRRTTSQSSSLPASPSTTGSTTTDGKKGRGPARPLPTWGTCQILEVEFNEYMQPVDESGVKLVSQLGCIARDCARVPLTYVKWTDMPDHVLEDIWRKVKDNTNVPEEYKHDCLRKVGVLWKERKSNLKKIHYYRHDTEEKRLANIPSKVSRNQWRLLVGYWGTEDAEALAQKNMANRAKQGLMHRTGRESFANLRKKMTQNGERTDMVDVFLKSRRNKKGEASPETAVVLTQLEGRLSQVPDSEQTTEKRDKIFKRFVGNERHGRVRTYIFGLSPTDVFRRSSAMTGPSEEVMANLRQNIRKEMREELLGEVEAQQARFRAEVEAQMQSRFDEMRANFMAEMFARNLTPSNLTTPPSSTGQVPDAESSRRVNAESSRHLDVGTDEDHNHADVDQDV